MKVITSLVFIVQGASAHRRKVAEADISSNCPDHVGGIDASGSFSIHECNFDQVSTESYTESERIMGLLTAEQGSRSTCAYKCGPEEVVCYSQWLGPGNFVWKCGDGHELAAHEQNQGEIVLRDVPASRAELPSCPCTIYSGFCSRWDLHVEGQDWGVACVAAEDALVTMHWMVQCVPIRAGGLEYECPAHLPVMCDAERTQEPCDTSALGQCSAIECAPGRTTKSEPPVFCQLSTCTQSECCEVCPSGASFQGSECVSLDGLRLHDSCCATAESGEEIIEEISCAARILALAEPTTARMDAYMTTCNFSPEDVDVSSPVFALTRAGEEKLCEAPCQAADVLIGSPTNVWAEAQSLATECDDLALTSQTSPVGLFAATFEMDTEWRACSDESRQWADSGGDGFVSKDTPR